MLYKFKNPATPEEVQERFVMVEPRGDRALFHDYHNTLNMPAGFVYLLSDMVELTEAERLVCTVSRIKSEVLADIESGRVPATVASFSELHDYVDANCYGGFCEENGITDALIEAFGGRDDNEGMPDGAVEYINDAQNAVHAWLANGRKD